MMWRVVIGATQLTWLGPEAQVRTIKRLQVHEHYSNITQRNDIALLELDQPVQCGYYVQLACVPDASLRVSQLRTCYVSGWGSTTARGEFPKGSGVRSAGRAHWGGRLGFLRAEAKARVRLRDACRWRGGPGPLPQARQKGDSGTVPLETQSPVLGQGFSQTRGWGWGELAAGCWLLTPFCPDSWGTK